MKSIVILITLVFVCIFGYDAFSQDITVYLFPSFYFFADAVGIGFGLGSMIEIGNSKFSPSDTIAISPEISFFFSQAQVNSFSLFAVKFIPTYNVLIYSFEKRNNLFLKLGIGTGISFNNVSVRTMSLSSISLVFEPVLGFIYNFYSNFWAGVDIKYTISSDINNRITSMVSPSISVPIAIRF